MEDNNKNGVELILDNYLSELLNPINKKEKATADQYAAAALSYILYGCGDSITANYYFPWSIKEFDPKSKYENFVKAGTLLALAIDKLNETNDSDVDIEVENDNIRTLINKLIKKLNYVSTTVKNSYKADSAIETTSNDIQVSILDNNLENINDE